MTIINNKKTAKVLFKEIAIGEVFFNPMTDDYFMRLEGFYDENEELYNAINLRNGEFSKFSEIEIVERVKAELYISNY